MEESKSAAQRDEIMQFFAYAHLPSHIQEASAPFGELAEKVHATLPRNPERTVALRKLLEAKDAAVRSLLSRPPKPGPDWEWDTLALRWVRPGATTGPAINHVGVGA